MSAILNNERAWMTTAAGILDICAGASCMIGAAVLAFIAVAARTVPQAINEPLATWPFALGFAMFFGLSAMLFILGLVAIIGGVAALRRARSLWPIAGAIAATLTCLPLGVTSIILTVMSEQGPVPSRPGSN